MCGQTRQIYPDEVILRMWRCTGEDLPSFLLAVAANSSTNGNGSTGSHEQNEVDDADHELHHTQLPMKLNAHSANPVLDVLKRIDYHKAVLQYLERTIQEKHQSVLLHATFTYQSSEDVLADRTTTAAQLKRRVEDCLRLVKLRNVSLATAIELSANGFVRAMLMLWCALCAEIHGRDPCAEEAARASGR